MTTTADHHSVVAPSPHKRDLNDHQSSSSLCTIILTTLKELHHNLTCHQYLVLGLQDVFFGNLDEDRQQKLTTHGGQKGPSYLQGLQQWIGQIEQHYCPAVEQLLTSCVAAPEIAPYVNTNGVATLLRRYREEILPALRDVLQGSAHSDDLSTSGEDPQGRSSTNDDDLCWWWTTSSLLHHLDRATTCLTRLCACFLSAPSPSTTSVASTTYSSASPRIGPPGNTVVSATALGALAREVCQKLKESEEEKPEAKTKKAEGDGSASTPMCATCQWIREQLRQCMEYILLTTTDPTHGSSGSGATTAQMGQQQCGALLLPMDRFKAALEEQCQCGMLQFPLSLPPATSSSLVGEEEGSAKKERVQRGGHSCIAPLVQLSVLVSQQLTVMTGALTSGTAVTQISVNSGLPRLLQLKSHFDGLLLNATTELQQLVETYQNCLASMRVWVQEEKKRREHFEAIFQQKIKAFQHELQTLVHEESLQRRQFVENHGQHLPHQAFPELMQLPRAAEIRMTAAHGTTPPTSSPRES